MTMQENEYFRLCEVADGVFAAIETNRQCGSNAGIIDLGDATAVFDTFLNIDAARELQRLSVHLTGREPGYVINSHSHTDHIVGNSLFQNVTVISSHAAGAEIEKAGREFEKEKDTYPSEITSINAQLWAAKDDAEAANLKNTLQFLTNLAKSGVRISAPTLNFSGELELRGSKRSMRLTSFEAAHSKGDVIARLPGLQVCFMGDMLVQGTHPWLGSGNPEAFRAILARILLGEENYYIPGHGDIAGKQDLALMIQYIDELIELVNGKNSPEGRDYSIGDLSPVFQEWDGPCFSWNIQFLTGRLQGKAAGQ